MSRKKVGHFYKFGKHGPIFIISSLLNLEKICRGKSILTEFGGNVAHGLQKELLDFCGNPVHIMLGLG